MIRALLRNRWLLQPADEVFVREIACPHKDCGGFETVALVWREGRQIATLTVEKPLGQVGFADVDHALLRQPQPKGSI